MVVVVGALVVVALGTVAVVDVVVVDVVDSISDDVDATTVDVVDDVEFCSSRSATDAHAFVEIARTHATETTSLDTWRFERICPP
jgi:hypothetical protein